MPEYLAPAVYVEEVDTGSKPIEGVSTSTAGVIGVTERGPVNVPILITSFGEYRRWFGEYLNPADFGGHRFLPHALEGFFTNGGRRVFVTRVLEADAATLAERVLFEQQSRPVVSAPLLTRALRDATSLVAFGDLTTMTLPAQLRVGAGASAEYVHVTTAPTSATVLALSLPVTRTYSGTVTVEARGTVLPGGSATASVDGAISVGATTLHVKAASAAISSGQLLAIGSAANGDEELAVVESVAGSGANLMITLQAPAAQAHPDSQAISAYPMPIGAAGVSATSTLPLQAGDVVIAGLSAAIAGPNLLFVSDASHTEVRRVGTVQRVTLGVGAYAPYPAGSRLEHVNRADSTTAPTIRTLTRDAAQGSSVIELDDRSGITTASVLRIGVETDANAEYIGVASVPSGPTARVVLSAPLNRDHAAGPIVAVQSLDTTGIAVQTGAALLPVAEGGTVLISNNNAWPAATPVLGRILRVTTPDGLVFFHRMAAAVAPGIVASTVSFGPAALATPHPAAATLSSAEPLLEAVALDAGAWGNRLRVAARRQDPPLTRTVIRTVTGNAIRLASSAGVEVGTILQLTDVNGNLIGAPLKVAAIDRQNGYELTLATTAPLPPAWTPGAAIISVEFQLDVYLLRQPDPALPSRNDSVLDSESFRYLSLDHRHSRYAPQIVGATWTPGVSGDVDDTGRPLRKVDRRSEGESQYIRIYDRANDRSGAARTNELERLRLGPDLLLETLPDGRTRPARLPLAGGDDQITLLTDDHYVGEDAAEPIDRTGLETLRNVEEISIVASPGRTSPIIQGALINHCELMRYRFAVLDGTPPPGDTIADVQAQRSQFDSKYAALYHPWLLIRHPYPIVPGALEEYPVPPSGHMLGIYARTDVERGVHKAPANEVVRGIVGLRRTLNKEHHDILNPYPVNINVIRDFRPNNRGIRIYGGRVISSDSDWKYVNVRRLLIFIEASLDRGLQWVVFEPNAEPLWARVRRAIANFLTLVWRNGALEGVTREEAYFVKCDRTTMTQTDIDSGRLIVQVGVAPVKPAEFVIVRIGLWTAHADE